MSRGIYPIFLTSPFLPMLKTGARVSRKMVTARLFPSGRRSIECKEGLRKYPDYAIGKIPARPTCQSSFSIYTEKTSGWESNWRSVFWLAIPDSELPASVTSFPIDHTLKLSEQGD